MPPSTDLSSFDNPLSSFLLSLSVRQTSSLLLCNLHTHTHTLLIFTFTSSQCQTKPWKLLIIFSFFVWIESNKDPFLFDVIKLLRLDLGVRVNFSRASRGAIRKLQMSGALSSFTAPRFSFTSHKIWGGGGSVEKQTDSPDVVNPPQLAAQHLHWSNSPPYLDSSIPQAPFCAAIKIAHL